MSVTTRRVVLRKTTLRVVSSLFRKCYLDRRTEVRMIIRTPKRLAGPMLCPSRDALSMVRLAICRWFCSTPSGPSWSISAANALQRPQSEPNPKRLMI